MIFLENDIVRAEFSNHGGELVRFYNKLDKAELLWSGDEKFWGRHSPILFPFIGTLNNHKYKLDGTAYDMTSHGFARDMDFECTKQSENEVKFLLEDTEDTLKIYPFKFSLEISYRLQGGTLFVTWSVRNKNDKKMYYCIGGHPAFVCPVDEDTKKADCFVHFEGKKNLKYILIARPSGTAAFNDVRELNLEESDGYIHTTEELFANDALIFDNNQVTKISLCKPDKTPYITLECPSFSSFGLWSKPGMNAPFVCLEPWMGRCDNFGFEGELPEKFGIQTLSPGMVRANTYKIKVPLGEEVGSCYIG